MERLLTRIETLSMTGQKHAQLYRKIKAGTFPRPVQISKCRVAWKLSDVQSWISGLEYCNMKGIHDVARSEVV